MTRLPDGPSDPDYDGPQDRRMVPVMGMDRAGVYLRLHGRMVRDRERALADPDVEHWVRLMSGALLPSGRGPGARKGAQPFTVARALALWSLKSHLGLRPAARRVIIWDAELGTRFADEERAELMRRSEDRDPITEDERHRRISLESTIITSSERVWKTVGLRPASSRAI